MEQYRTKLRWSGALLLLSALIYSIHWGWLFGEFGEISLIIRSIGVQAGLSIRHFIGIAPVAAYCLANQCLGTGNGGYVGSLIIWAAFLIIGRSMLNLPLILFCLTMIMIRSRFVRIGIPVAYTLPCMYVLWELIHYWYWTGFELAYTLLGSASVILLGIACCLMVNAEKLRMGLIGLPDAGPTQSELKLTQVGERYESGQITQQDDQKEHTSILNRPDR